MPNPLSADIRARLEVLFSEEFTGREIGRRLMISAASASRLSQKLRQGLRLRSARNPRNTELGRRAPYHGFLIELVHQGPDITLKELQGALADAHDVTASASGIDQALKRLGYTYKISVFRGDLIHRIESPPVKLRMSASAQE